MENVKTEIMEKDIKEAQKVLIGIGKRMGAEG